MELESWTEAPERRFVDSASDPDIYVDEPEARASHYTDPDRWIVANPWLRDAFTRRPPPSRWPRVIDSSVTVSAPPVRHSRMARSIRFLLGLH